MKGPYFISIEGPEGAGKTTLIKKISPFLKNKLDNNFLITREPGGVKISEEIRNLVLNKKYPEINARTEALLFAASRAQHLAEKIIPALKAKKVVICDRFIDSSTAYQGYGRGLGYQPVYNINYFATRGLMPNLTLLLDLPSKIGLQRINKYRSNQINRIDTDALNFHKKVRQGYLKLASKNPKRIKIIDATQSSKKIGLDALQLIKKGLNGDL